MPQRVRIHLRSHLRGVLLLLSALLPGCATQDPAPGPASRQGATLYASCVPCHGERGEGLESAQAPRLAGREDWFVRRQIEEFRRRERGRDDSRETGFLPPEARAKSMHPVADTLSRADVSSLVAYLSTLPPGPLPPASKGDVARGRTHYAACVECHGSKAEGSRSRGAPRLTGQHDWYLFNQMRDFRMGWRGADAADPHLKLMRSRLDLDEEALRDLAAYLVNLTPAP